MSNQSECFRGRVVVVTGSSSGIGKAMALEFGRRNAHVVIHGRTISERLLETADILKSLGCNCIAIDADLGDPDSLPKLVDRAWEWQGKIDVWVNNAGADVLTGEAGKLSFEDKFDLVWKVDVRATLILSRLVGTRMSKRVEQLSVDEPAVNVKNRHSRQARMNSFILNVGWDQAWQGMEGDSGEMFSTTKGAVMSMTLSLAQSLAPYVRVNCIAPGWIKTQWGDQASPEWNQRAVSESLLNRWGTPEDVAKVASFLCSDQAGFVTGQVIPVNGGFRYGPG